MEMADLFAACFWPIVIVMALLLMTIRTRVSNKITLQAAFYAIGPLLILLFALETTSVFAVVDLYVLVLLFGLFLVSNAIFGPFSFARAASGASLGMLSRIASLLLGAVLVWFCGSILCLDYLDPPLILEGRVTPFNAGQTHHPYYRADIGGSIVNVTEAVYKRLKDRPVVRAEVGRGSNYIYKIEYLSR